ncbi:MAG TPA: histone deacetylase [Bryobacteraceae bacterium]|jgi:acetoin utilization deacetylase AcuC-like enzyme|nr:histone deacetylase [Bryobacteraceae bacterium]
MTSTTAILADPIYKEHWTGEGHPERPARFDVVVQALEREGFVKDAPRIRARLATEDEIALCHARKYIEIAKRDVSHAPGTMSTGDTEIGPRSFEVALMAVGGALNAVDAVFAGKARNAFCAVRPPGHHATPNRGMGFCLFNNVAIAARYAQKKHGIDTALIVDWDVHHGNGTQDIFYTDGSVFYFSTHQSPWYPGTGDADETGEGKGKGRILNCPAAAGAGRKEILGAFQTRLMPVMRDFKPDMVFVSAGFDSRLGDPLGQFKLTDADFTDLTDVMLEIADSYAGGRLVSLLEGGYSLTGLGAGVAAHVAALRGPG